MNLSKFTIHTTPYSTQLKEAELDIHAKISYWSGINLPVSAL